jgi:hypothetical protein
MSTLRVYANNNVKAIQTVAGGEHQGFLKDPLSYMTRNKPAGVWTETGRNSTDIWYATAKDALVWVFPTPSSGYYAYTNFGIYDPSNNSYRYHMNNTYTPSGFGNSQQFFVPQGWSWKFSVTLGNQNTAYIKEYYLN